MSLSAVAIDRYLVISRPLDLAKKPTRTHAYITVLLIWIYSAVFASMPLLGFGKYVPEGYLTSCSFDYLSDDVGTRIFILTFFLAAWVTPFTIIISCYSAIIYYAAKVQKELNLGTGEQENHRLSYRHSTSTTVAGSNFLNFFNH